MYVQPADLVTIALLVVLEGLLSADNALVLAIMILGLPRVDQRKALRYGIVGAFAFRTVATLLASSLIKVGWVKVLGAAYLLYLTCDHFAGAESAEARTRPKAAEAWLGMTALWATVVKVELVNIAFSVDSILVAVAMSRKLWVILTGGFLGIVAMRVVIAQLLDLVRRYPTLVDGAFVIIAWVGIKLLIEYLHAAGYVSFEVNKWLSLSLIAIIFAVAYFHARRKGPAPDEPDAPDEASSLFSDES